MEKTREKILDAIKENKKITHKELAKRIGVTEKTIERNINRLKEEGVLYRIGSKKTGSWGKKQE